MSEDPVKYETSTIWGRVREDIRRGKPVASTAENLAGAMLEINKLERQMAKRRSIWIVMRKTRDDIQDGYHFENAAAEAEADQLNAKYGEERYIAVEFPVANVDAGE